MQLKRNLLSVALASATLMLAHGAHAQDATAPAQTAEEEAQDLDAVQVVGIRRGIEDSIDTKQAEDTIVEAISAEDIGKLPDTSIADSLARLPGLTAQRFGSRPQEIHIRGFAGDFSTALLNGREQVSLGNNRGVEFDQYPSELTSQVVVHKTTDASLVGQGLSGTVNLKTVRPLSFSDQVVAVNVRGDMNDRDGDKRYGNRFTLSYIDQFADNTVGLALGYARLNNPQQGTQFEAWGYDGGTGLLGGGKLYDIQNDNTRDGLMGVLEFKPNDEWHSTLDVFYSKFDKEEIKRGMEFGLNNRVGNAQSFTFSDFRPVIRNDYNAAKDDLFAIGWRNEIKLGEQWSLALDISNSSGTRDQRVLETYAGLPDATPGTTGSATFNPEGYFDFDFGLDFGDPSILRLTDAGGWGQDGYLKDFKVKDSLTSVRADLTRAFDAGFVSSIDFGVNLTDRSKSRASNENFLCLSACRDNVELPIPAGLLTGSSFNFASVTGIVGYDALDAFNSIYNRRANVNNGDINQKNWEVEERVTTAYVQANINTDLGPVPLRGNIGVQAVSVEQSSSGVSTFEGLTLSEEAEYGANYTDYLPSMNLSFGLPADQFIRVGAGRQVARPRMDDLRANAGFGINRSVPANGCPAGDPAPCPRYEGSGGNPTLQPWLANAYDVSYEKYFGGNKGYVSAAYFYKDLRTYIYNQATQFDFSQLPVPPGVLPQDVPQSSIGTYTQPVNGNGGTVKGYEVAISLPFDLFFAPLEGFGFVGNYSDTQSSIQPLGPAFPDEPLPGLSKYVSNMTLYYERYGFSVRASQRNRSKFLGEVEGFGGDRTKIQFEGETIYDAQIGYTFQTGPLENLSILLQANNIGNEPFRSTFGSEDRPRQYFGYGRTYLLGLNYRF
jgi:iron complex outermembrane receptor protein